MQFFNACRGANPFYGHSTEKKNGFRLSTRASSSLFSQTALVLQFYGPKSSSIPFHLIRSLLQTFDHYLFKKQKQWTRVEW